MDWASNANYSTSSHTAINQSTICIISLLIIQLLVIKNQSTHVNYRVVNLHLIIMKLNKNVIFI